MCVCVCVFVCVLNCAYSQESGLYNKTEGASVIKELAVNGDEYESEDDTFDDDHAQDVFVKFILSLPLDDQQMLAVLLAESFRTTQGMGVVDAAREAGSIVSYSDKTVRKLRK